VTTEVRDTAAAIENCATGWERIEQGRGEQNTPIEGIGERPVPRAAAGLRAVEPLFACHWRPQTDSFDPPRRFVAVFPTEAGRARTCAEVGLRPIAN
jgi:hypothetical protein